MKKIFIVPIILCTFFSANAQTDKSKPSVITRAGDHIMLQLGTDQWAGVPDSIKSHKTGLSRGANVYVMLNKPFKSNNHLSAAFGIGVSTSNMYFSKLNFDIKSTAAKLPITDLSNSNRFKKYKLTTAYLEVPVEIRYSSDPENDAKSIKGALGVKAGQLLSVHTKGKTLEDASGKALNSYTYKETSKRFFNGTRISITGRVGYGHFSLFGSYAVGNMLKDGVGPAIKPYQVGLCISGL